MTFSYSNSVSKNATSVTQKILGKNQKKSDSGGYVFQTSLKQSFDRFLIIGSTSGTFYVSKQDNMKRNLDKVVEYVKADGVGAVKRLVEVSTLGLASKNDHAIMALALCFTHGDESCKYEASNALTKVCRTGTHILMFTALIKDMRGFGRTVKTAIQNWYTSKSSKDMAFQLSKYQNRNGWTHRDVFRLTHPKFDNVKNEIVKWALNKDSELDFEDEGHRLLGGVDYAKICNNPKDLIKAINDYGLQREHIPTQFLSNPLVQEHLLKYSGATAILRNLSTYSASGLFAPLTDASKFVCQKLKDREFIKKGKLHPLSILTALRTYSEGRNNFGSSWKVNQNIVASLNKAFELSFDTVEPCNKNFLVGVDISGSMSWGGTYGMKSSEVAATIALTLAKTEPWTFIGGFSSNFIDLNISSSDTLATVMNKTSNKTFGSTNIGSAIEYAINNNMNVDTFVIITDNDVNSGKHASQLLNDYRRRMNKPNAKLIVIGLEVNDFTVADPSDPNQLDIAGFSPDLTSIISNFSR